MLLFHDLRDMFKLSSTAKYILCNFSYSSYPSEFSFQVLLILYSLLFDLWLDYAPQLTDWLGWDTCSGDPNNTVCYM